MVEAHGLLPGHFDLLLLPYGSLSFWTVLLVRLVASSFWLLLSINGVIHGEPRHAVYRTGLAEFKPFDMSRDEVSVERYHDLVVAALVALLAFLYGSGSGPKFRENPLVSECAVDCSGNCTLGRSSGACKRVLSIFRQHRVLPCQDYGYPYCLAVTLLCRISRPAAIRTARETGETVKANKKDDAGKTEYLSFAAGSLFRSGAG